MLVVGDVALFRVRVFDEATLSLGDPEVLSLSVLDPSGTVTTLAGADIVRVSTGVHTATMLLSLPGGYAWRWHGTGRFEGAIEGRFSVAKSNFPSPLI